MSPQVTASPEESLRQASMTAHQYFHAAIKTIDEQFRAGFAQTDPELIGAFMRTAARDFNSVITVQVIQVGLREISEAIMSHNS